MANGSTFLSNADGRSLWVRRARDVATELTQDKGGPESVTAAEALLIRRAATLTVECERLEQRFASVDAEPHTDDLDLHQRMTGALRRVLDSLGLGRRARPLSQNEAAHAAIERAIRSSKR